MSDVISGANTIAYILFTVIGVMFFLYSKSVEKQFEFLKEEIMLLRNDSKQDDAEVKLDLKEEINRRVGQTTDLHARVGSVEAANCSAQIKIAKLEGLQEGSK